MTRAELLVWCGVLFAVAVSAFSGQWRRNAAAEVSVRIADVERFASSELAPAGSGRLDLNSASADELALLPGIGARRAQLIVQERRKRGAFNSVWELCEVPSLSRALVQRLEPLLKVSRNASPAR